MTTGLQRYRKFVRRGEQGCAKGLWALVESDRIAGCFRKKEQALAAKEGRAAIIKSPGYGNFARDLFGGTSKKKRQPLIPAPCKKKRTVDSVYECAVGAHGLYTKAFFGHKATSAERAKLNRIWKAARRAKGK